MGLPEHRKNAVENARVAIITVSDTRDLKSDKSGQEIARLVEEAKHAVADRVVVRDEPTRIGAALRGFLGDAGVDAVILTGGTGLAARGRCWSLSSCRHPLLQLLEPVEDDAQSIARPRALNPMKAHTNTAPSPSTLPARTIPRGTPTSSGARPLNVWNALNTTSPV